MSNDGDIDRATLLPRSGLGVVTPWLVMSPPGNPIIRIDLRGLDRVELLDAEPTDLVLVCGELEVSIYVAEGRAAAAALAEQAAPLTRGAPNVELLRVGDDVVVQRGDYIKVGNIAFRIAEVREYALQGYNLPLTEGRLLQAAMALLVVAQAERDEALAP